MKAHAITGNHRVFERSALGLKEFFRFMDAVFDACELPGFVIRELLSRWGRPRGFLHTGSRTPSSIRLVRGVPCQFLALPGFTRVLLGQVCAGDKTNSP